MALDFPASSASPFTAPNGVVYTWNTDGYWEAKADPNDFDSDYLKLNATNDPVTGNLALNQDLNVGDNLAVTGTSNFTGLTTHEAGVEVTGVINQSGASCTFRPGTNEATNISFSRNSTISPKLIINRGGALTGTENALIVTTTDSSDIFHVDYGGGAYFNGLTEHANGVKVSGGTQTDGHIIGNADGSIVLNDSNRITLTSAANSGTGISMRINNLDKNSNVIGLGITTGQTGRTSSTTLNQVYSNLDTDYGSNAYAYVARSTATHNTSGITVTGYYTALNNSDAPNGSVYSFYAGGTAPNYFKGDVLSALYVKNRTALLCQKKTDGSLAANDFSDQVINPRLSKKHGAAIRNEGQVLAFLGTSADGWQVGRQNDGQLLGFYNSGNTLVGQFGISGGALISPGASDYRLKTNIVDLPSATTAVKQLRPVNFELIGFEGYTHTGFIAHELQEHFAEGVFGTKDATEAIGTLADYDGTELETAVVEPSAEELEYTEEVEATPAVAAVAATYDEEGNELTAEVPEVEATYTTVTRTKTWTATGTQPVYQGVDQTKLIPLLTKALQEALERIEALEAAATA